ncbi:unnamed protein product, partial [Ectocarpus fasciculatus]
LPRAQEHSDQSQTRLCSVQEMETKVILDDVNAVFKPSTTTLVLGAPGSGK